MLARLFTLVSRLVCALVGVGVCVGLAVGAADIVKPDLVAWWRVLGPVWVVAAAILAALLARAGLAPGRLLERVPRPVFAGLIFVVAVAAGVAAHFAIQKGVPDVPDEFSYLHQARGFADGFLAPPSPPLSEFHYVSWGIHDHGRWYSVFPPAYGVVLAVGVKLGAPYLVNPVLTGLLALALFAFARELFGGDGIAPRVGVLVFLASWFPLMHAGSYMSHPTAALFTVLACLGAWRGLLRGGSVGWGLVAGASVAALVATRPLNAAILVALLVPAALHAWLVRRAPLRRLLAPALAAAPILLGYGLYNRALTGSATLPPQQRFMMLKEERGDCFRLGFGPGVGQCPITQNTNFGKDGFQPKNAAVNTARRLDAYLRYSFALSPLALLPGLAAFLGALGIEPRRRAFLAMVLASALGGYALFFYHGVAYGARFLYETWPFVALLTGALAADAARKLARWPLVPAALGGALVATLAGGLVATWPMIDRTVGQRNRTSNGAQLAPMREPAYADALIFSDSQVIPAAMTLHPGFIDENHPLVVRDNGDAANAGFLRLYPHRRPFRLSGTRLVPLSYAPDAPVRNEGGALYPLEESTDGFGDRVNSDATFKLPLSSGAALRFRGRKPGASFGFATYQPEDATVAFKAVAAAYPQGPTVDLLVDGVAAGVLDTRAGKPALVESAAVALPLARGRHWVEVRLRQPGAFYLDHVELGRP